MSWAKSMGYAALMAAISTLATWATQADKTQNLESLVGAAQDAQAKGDFSAAAEYYRQAVKVSPNTGNYSEAIGAASFPSGATVSSPAACGRRCNVSTSFPQHGRLTTTRPHPGGTALPLFASLPNSTLLRRRRECVQRVARSDHEVLPSIKLIRHRPVRYG